VKLGLTQISGANSNRQVPPLQSTARVIASAQGSRVPHADSTRPVRTLSGGETFQASLALALALSRQVASLAASGAAKLESIFLDEGFGTLDETSLDVVAATLENLAATGERMVGVITHVPALADRIPVRFQVTRSGAKSRIERITA